MQHQPKSAEVSITNNSLSPSSLPKPSGINRKKETKKGEKKESKKETRATKWQMPTCQIKLEYSARGQIKVIWKRLIKKKKKKSTREPAVNS